MQFSNPNNVKIYNLTAGRSLPEWLSSKRKNKLRKRHVELEKRVELIQNFSMPHISNTVCMSKNQRYILVTGVHSPRLRVFDTEEMSMKFEVGLDALPIRLLTIDDDYSKVVLLKNDRYVEFHQRGKKLYRTRVPKFACDMAFYTETCDLYVATCYNEVYRLNLEQGRFLNPLKLAANEATCCEINPVHHLFTCGTTNGTVECWDPRTRFRAGILDCKLSQYHYDASKNFPTVTTLKYRDGLMLGVGTSSGHILLYDIRSPKPVLVKDHNYDLPIKKIHFQEKEDVVISMDQRIVKMWHRETGKPYTHIEPPETQLNDLCVVPDTGLMFMANENPKLLTYYVPSLGPAPRWCSFLDNITEELEETMTATVYDDYKFITRKELEDMNLSGLIGSDLLRGYMHGFFVDNRLYQKAKGVLEPFAHEEYRQRKIKEKIDADRKTRLQTKEEGPAVNKQLAAKLSTLVEPSTILADDRFSSLFKNPEFEIDKTNKEFRHVRYGMKKLDDKEHQKKEEADAKQAGEDQGEPDEPHSETETRAQSLKPDISNETPDDFHKIAKKNVNNVSIREKLKLMSGGSGKAPEVHTTVTPYSRHTKQVETVKMTVAAKSKKETSRTHPVTPTNPGSNNLSIRDKLKMLSTGETIPAPQPIKNVSTSNRTPAQIQSTVGHQPLAVKRTDVSAIGSQSADKAKASHGIFKSRRSEVEKKTQPTGDATKPQDKAPLDMFKIKEVDTMAELNAPAKEKRIKVPLGERLKEMTLKGDTIKHTSFGAKEMSFKIATKEDEKTSKRKLEAAKHRVERKRIRRSAHTILPPMLPDERRGFGK